VFVLDLERVCEGERFLGQLFKERLKCGGHLLVGVRFEESEELIEQFKQGFHRHIHETIATLRRPRHRVTSGEVGGQGGQGQEIA
jgi:hypothetical protein